MVEKVPIFIEFDGTSPSSINVLVSGTDIIASSVGGTGVSSYAPHLVPFASVRFTSNSSVTSTDEYYVGSGVVGGVYQNSHDITWDDTNKYFLVSSQGAYEINMNAVVLAGTTGDCIVRIRKNATVLGGLGDLSMNSSQGVHTSTDPIALHLTDVLELAAGDNVFGTIDGIAGTLAVRKGTTLTLRRVS